jgi:hypothetical protein
MSLYNMLHGYEPTAQFVLQVLNLAPAAIPRFRDAYITYRDETKTVPMMVVLTRTGANNRHDYVEENDKLRQVTGYIDDIDDEFDVTFALFRYAVPNEYETDVLQYLLEHGQPLTLRQKTEQAIGPDQTKRQKDASQNIMEQLRDAIDPQK